MSGKLDRTTDEKYLQVIGDQVLVTSAVLSFMAKPSGSRGFRRVLAAEDGGKPDKDQRAHANFGQAVFTQVHLAAHCRSCRRLRNRMRTRPAGMRQAFREAFPVEMRDLFSELIVVQRGGAAFAKRA